MTTSRMWTLAACMAIATGVTVVVFGAEPGVGDASRSGNLSPAMDRAFAVLRPTSVRDGRLYTPFYNHVIGPQAVVEGGAVFCAFQDHEGRPVVMAYDVRRKRWAGPVLVAEFGLGRDGHGNPSLAIDDRGHLHVFYGCHGGPMRHARSAKPHDITAWQEQPSPTPHATYPQTMRMADGTALLFYRAGGHMEPWCVRESRDDCRTWSEPERIVEMRLDPPDRLAAAYCFFFPGVDKTTVHCFWNHKDDNAARVTADRPHPWRPLKYPGLHEAVYRYNVYYLRRDAEGTWRNAAGEAVKLPVSKAEADRRCLVYDSGDEFTFLPLGSRLAVDGADRPYMTIRMGVVDWVTDLYEPKVVRVPPRPLWMNWADGRWQTHVAMPADWPAGVKQEMTAPGPAARGGEEARGWHLFTYRRRLEPELGATVFLYHAQRGFATREGGPALVP